MDIQALMQAAQQGDPQAIALLSTMQQGGGAAQGGMPPQPPMPPPMPSGGPPPGMPPPQGMPPPGGMGPPPQQQMPNPDAQARQAMMLIQALRDRGGGYA